MRDDCPFLSRLVIASISVIRFIVLGAMNEQLRCNEMKNYK
jgi:hypothetical protein